MARITFGPLNESEGKRNRDVLRDGVKIATLTGDVGTTYHKGVLRGNLYHVVPEKGNAGKYAKAVFSGFTWFTWTMARRGILALERGKPAPTMVGNEPQLAPSVAECDAIAAARDAQRIADAEAQATKADDEDNADAKGDLSPSDVSDLAAVASAGL